MVPLPPFDNGQRVAAVPLAKCYGSLRTLEGRAARRGACLFCVLTSVAFHNIFVLPLYAPR